MSFAYQRMLSSSVTKLGRTNKESIERKAFILLYDLIMTFWHWESPSRKRNQERLYG